jgi:hypothetical protein
VDSRKPPGRAESGMRQSYVVASQRTQLWRAVWHKVSLSAIQMSGGRQPQSQKTEEAIENEIE